MPIPTGSAAKISPTNVIAGRDDRRQLVEAADRLAGIGNAALAVQLVALVLRRAAEQATRGAIDPELAPGEALKLAALVRGRRLDRWMGLWDKLRDLPGELDHLNLDPRQTLFLALAALAGGCGTLGELVMRALKKDAGVRYWGNRSSVTGAVGLLDRVAPLCFAAPVFFHSVRWYFA